MAEKINIEDLMVESYSDKTLKSYSGMIADPKSVFGLGSAAATSSMCAASMALRALRMTASEDADMLHAEQDMEKLRVYFLHLIDEENKAKKPLEKLLKKENADDTELEAAYRTACCIIDEIFYMSIRIVETLEPVADKICPCAAHFASAAVHFAKCGMDAVRIQMRRRAPGSSDLTTHRSETDDPLVMSGILNGVTTGAPISAIFRNKDQNSAAYHPEIPRPSHADYAATVRFGGHADLRGGGPFSGRLTACLVFAGAVCRQILERRGITITANAVRVGQATGKELNFDMKRAILDARSAGDSVGSELECVVMGVPAGVGGLLFGGMESRIAGMLYAIPGVKGVEFGRGFALAEMRGSEANDPIRLKNGRIIMASNNAGGINGGITNGMPLVVRMALRPTPSIACEQPSVDLVTMEETPLRINGRHDPCLAPRAIPVMEAALACCVLDAMLDTAATI